MNGVNSVSTKVTIEYLNQLQKVQTKIDSYPYENFPFCCSSNNTVNFDADLTNKYVPIKKRSKDVQ